MGDSSFKILAFDGGGLRGALSITLLRRIQMEIPDIVKTTNLIGGTSTGSLIALGLAYGVSPSDIEELYSIENAKYIFQKEYSELIRPKYDNTHLKETLLRIFPSDLKLKDLGKLVVIPSFYIGNETSSWKPIFYNNLPNSPTEDARVVDVAMSSSAAPVFFPTYNYHVDGGIIATDPSLVSLIYAMGNEIGKEIDNIRVMSFGTGYCYNSIKQDTTKWGAVDWIVNKDPSVPIISITLEGNSQMSQFLTEKLLNGNYCRINPRMNRDIAMDDWKAMDYLLDIGENYNLDKYIRWLKKQWN